MFRENASSETKRSGRGVEHSPPFSVWMKNTCEELCCHFFMLYVRGVHVEICACKFYCDLKRLLYSLFQADIQT
jgi:hypothetical protein